jgi:hypothetical protein
LADVPDLHLRIAPQVDAAVSLGHGFVFDHQFDVAEFFFRCGVGPGADIHEFAILDPPMLREFGPLLLEIGRPLFALELGPIVRIPAIPPGKILAIEDGAEAFRGRRVGCVQKRGRKQSGDDQGER